MAINYFNIYDVFVNELIGDIWLFVLIGIVVIWFVSMKTRMPYQVPLLFTILWIGIIFSVATEALLIGWIFTVLIAGLLFYLMQQRIIRRG